MGTKTYCIYIRNLILVSIEEERMYFRQSSYLRALPQLRLVLSNIEAGVGGVTRQVEAVRSLVEVLRSLRGGPPGPSSLTALIWASTIASASLSLPVAAVVLPLRAGSG